MLTQWLVGTIVLVNAVQVSPELLVAEGYDDVGGSMIIEPVNPDGGDDRVLKCLVHPDSEKFTLNLSCSPGSTLTIDGKSQRAGGEHQFKRDKQRHTQVIEAVCTNPKMPADSTIANTVKYALLVESDYPADEIPIPKLSVLTTDDDCIFNEQDAYFQCPTPLLKNETSPKQIAVTSVNEPTIKYLLQDTTGKQVDIRLLNGKPTVEFPWKNPMKLKAMSGQATKEWPVYFGGKGAPSFLKIIGAILGTILALLLATLLLVVGSTSICGMGVPLGATEIASAFTLVMQYLSFSSFFPGSKVDTLVAPARWITLFGPSPAAFENVMTGSNNAPAGESPQFGDITNVRSAWGALFWALGLAALLLAIHGVVIGLFKSKEDRFTFPHRVRFGNWENRLMNWLAFPLAAAATSALISDKGAVLSKVTGGVVLLVAMAWIGIVFSKVASSVSNKEVCWIWNSSVRESGRPAKKDDNYLGDGYWGDVTSDQLVTQPVNRSILSFFPYQWISTVADISPTSLSHSLISDSNSQIYPPQKMKRAHKNPAYPTAKAPQVVTVVKTREEGPLCKGQRLMTGLLRTRWLDILFTYEGLVKFFSDEQGNCQVPLMVKTSQLSGPITSGPNAFFYDGARVPFIRIAETIYKIALGVLVALCGAGIAQGPAFLTIFLLSMAMLGYIVATKPYARTLENWLMMGVYGVIGLCGLGFALNVFRNKDTFGGILSWLVAACAIVLSIYAIIVIYSVFTAICCPPLDESRFLEKLSNCTVTIIDPSGTDQFDTPGYSKYAARDLLAKTGNTADENRSSASSRRTAKGRIHVERYGGIEEFTLEFYHNEIRQACRTGELPIPTSQ